jgi:hypothetical protein
MCLCRFRREADCADGLRGRFLEVTGNRHAADYVPFAFSPSADVSAMRQIWISKAGRLRRSPDLFNRGRARLRPDWWSSSS